LAPHTPRSNRWGNWHCSCRYSAFERRRCLVRKRRAELELKDEIIAEHDFVDRGRPLPENLILVTNTEPEFKRFTQP
jgi:hypothetical protein